MRGERQLLHIGEFLVGRACQRLPRDIREERYREWAAELPAILHDSQIRPAPRRAVRMLAYAADTLRGTVMTSVGARRRTLRVTPVLSLLLVAGLVSLAWDIWTIVRAPGNALNYLELAWSLLIMAYLMSVIARSARRVTGLLALSCTTVGVVVNLWNAARAPGDWVYYFLAAVLFLLSAAGWVVLLWARTKRRKAARAAR